MSDCVGRGPSALFYSWAYNVKTVLGTGTDVNQTCYKEVYNINDVMKYIHYTRIYTLLFKSLHYTNEEILDYVPLLTVCTRLYQ